MSKGKSNKFQLFTGNIWAKILSSHNYYTGVKYIVTDSVKIVLTSNWTSGQLANSTGKSGVICIEEKLDININRILNDDNSSYLTAT
jgi:hypothetical protein